MSQEAVSPQTRQELYAEFHTQRRLDPNRLPYVQWLESLVIEQRADLARDDASAAE